MEIEIAEVWRKWEGQTVEQVFPLDRILGAGENSLRLAPPLMIDEQQADFAIDTLAACIREDERSH